MIRKLGKDEVETYKKSAQGRKDIRIETVGGAHFALVRSTQQEIREFEKRYGVKVQ